MKNFISINGIKYAINEVDKSAIVEIYEGSEKEVVIPAEITYNKQLFAVTAIGKRAFRDCESLVKVVIAEGVKEIGRCAFEGCASLRTVIAPSSVVQVESHAFANTPWLRWYPSKQVYVGRCFYKYNDDYNFEYYYSNVEIKEGTVQICDEAFADCFDSTFECITIPNSVKMIGRHAFRHCVPLEKIEIPASVELIAIDAFENCDCLTRIEVDENNKNYASIDGVLYDKEIKILIYYPYARKSLSFTIPDGVVEIWPEAFKYCILEKIEIPASLEDVREGTFFKCKSLKAIDIDVNNKNYVLIDGVLYDRDIKTLVYCLQTVEFTSFTIPDGVEQICDFAFCACELLNKIIIPNSVNHIGEYALSAPSLIEITCLASTPPFLAECFCNKLVLKVPRGLKDVYENDCDWSEFKIIEEI